MQALTLPSLLRDQAARQGRRPWVQAPGGALSYAEAPQHAARWAALLAAAGVARGDRVGLMAGNRIEFLSVVLGCGWLGAVVVPINTASRGMQLQHILANSGCVLLVAIPVSFGIAVFLTELCPPALRGPLGVAVELLAAVPSIIYGMWGLFVFAPLFADYIQPLLTATLGHLPLIGGLFQGPQNGIGILSAGLILSVMVIPFIASVMRDVFEVVPGILKESAYGLGATTWEVVWNIVLPYTRVGVIGGVMLGLGRALGETMAVTFVIGNAHRISPSLYEAGNSIASTLANEFAEAASDLHVSSLIALGLILFFVTFVVLACSKVLLMRLGRSEGEKT